MANEEQLLLLKQGVHSWNKSILNNFLWLNFSGADLSETNLSGLFLCWANLSRANLRSSSLCKVNLCFANLSSANLNRAVLSASDLSSANLSYANLNGVNLNYTILREINLREADLSGASAKKADFSNANLNRSTLKQADLSEAKLNEANLSEVDLSGANLRRADLTSANLFGANLSNADLLGANLSNADLSSANISNANVSWANLSGANLFGANLFGANLLRSQLLSTNLTKTILTGVCIEDWHINNNTKLVQIDCEYIYFKRDQQSRRPFHGEFVRGEFSKLFQQAIETVDLIFVDGIDWKAFFSTFQEIKKQYENNIALQAIERKQGGAFVIRLEVSSGIDKAEIERNIKTIYEMKLHILEIEYKVKLQAKDSEIELYKQKSADLLEIVKLQASKPIINQAMAFSENQSKKNTYDLSNAKFGGGFAADGGTSIGGTLYDFSSSLDLVDAAAKIQALLSHLQQQGESSHSAQEKAAETLANQAKQDPTTLGKLVKWGQTLGDTAAKTTVSEAAKEVIKLALRLVGVPLL